MYVGNIYFTYGVFMAFSRFHCDFKQLHDFHNKSLPVTIVGFEAMLVKLSMLVLEYVRKGMKRCRCW